VDAPALLGHAPAVVRSSSSYHAERRRAGYDDLELPQRSPGKTLEAVTPSQFRQPLAIRLPQPPRQVRLRRAQCMSAAGDQKFE
jgi:hypothetical protein